MPSCWYAGPELAVGGLDSAAGGLLQTRLAELSLRLAADCSAGQRERILVDVHAGRAHLLFILKLKLGSWKQLPGSLLGMAHFSPTVAKPQMAVCVQQYDACADRSRLHPLCHKVLGEGSPYRPIIDSILAGTLAQPWPKELLMLLGSWRCVSVVERWIEGRHAQLKKALRLAPHHGPAMVGFCVVGEDVAATVHDDPDSLKDLAACCDAARTPLASAEALGLSGHPGILSLIREHGRHAVNKKCAKTIKEIIFHCAGLTCLYTVFDPNY